MSDSGRAYPPVLMPAHSSITYSPAQRRAVVEAVLIHGHSQTQACRMARAGQLGNPPFAPTQQTLSKWLMEYTAERDAEEFTDGDADLTRAAILESLGIAAWANRQAWRTYKQRATRGKGSDRTYQQLVKATRELAMLDREVHGRPRAGKPTDVDDQAPTEQPAPQDFLQAIAGAEQPDHQPNTQQHTDSNTTGRNAPTHKHHNDTP